ncbi:MAG TPA: MMPL family transporter, partial [Candidatus Limnocylindrales bacterium]|nr:MMPL family transporter [Candidatus Limnocylindrales bacterium]
FAAEPISPEGRQLVEAVRAVPAPGAEVLVGGDAAGFADLMDMLEQRLPWMALLVVLTTFVLLFLAFGSLILPIKAIIMNVLSLSAAFGAVVWIFQDGRLTGLLDFTSTGNIDVVQPILILAVAFGLSMDYEVFLLSRIRERYLATGDNTRAVAEGIGITGGIITGAALIMVAVFGAFALSSVSLIKSLGFSMALAVLIDATLVRGVLVPAFMRVMGSVNWWAPRWVQRGVARVGLYEGAPEPARA